LTDVSLDLMFRKSIGNAKTHIVKPTAYQKIRWPSLVLKLSQAYPAMGIIIASVS
jgi:hypothetical protein